MLKIADTNCYSTTELINAVGGDFSPKKIDNLRNIGLLPASIKVGTGRGIVGYYPDTVLNHLKTIEAEHRKGHSYPDLVIKFGERVLVIDVKVTTLRDVRHARRQAAKYITQSLNPKLQAQHSIKLSKWKDGELINQDIVNLKMVLRRLFRRKDVFAPEVLAMILQHTRKLQELQIAEQAYLQSAQWVAPKKLEN